MSIVISVIDKNKKLYIASDKRGIKNGVADDNYRKVYLLSPNYYFGMTGIYEDGMEILSLIKKAAWSSRTELIKSALSCFDSYCVKKQLNKMTMVIAGKDKEGFFIFQRNICGNTMNVKTIDGSMNIEYAINAADKISDFNKYLENKIVSGKAIRDSIIETIEYASTIDSSVSKTFDLYEVV